MRIFQKFLWIRSHLESYLVTIEFSPNASCHIYEVLRHRPEAYPEETLSIKEDLTWEERRTILLEAAKLWEEFWTKETDVINNPRNWIAWHDAQYVAEVMEE